MDGMQETDKLVWVYVGDGPVDDISTSRARVPGGWLYATYVATNVRDASYTTMLSTTFIPDVPFKSVW